MAEIGVLVSRVRKALGDPGYPFRVVLDTPGSAFDIGHRYLTGVIVSLVTGSQVSDLPASAYTLDSAAGALDLHEELRPGSSLLVTGTAHTLFTDAEIAEFVQDAARQHCHEREITVRKRNANGFIYYEETPLTLATLPAVEEEPLAILGTIEALWAMATDAASDVDVWTAEGTHLSRAQRYQQLMGHIESLQARYEKLCKQLNIGLYRIEVSTLRRVSRLTGRLVPVFASREYDDYQPPRRLLPPIDAPHEDESGLPSPIWGGYGA
ncbi:hypothetical protein ACFWYW_24210 [Nonomuraea sp. NPDC059023]|uniref:hypothetical protein n=1 Tax=unclassified Nonomuraea TaxID=2593643 RepID=UPI003677209D